MALVRVGRCVRVCAQQWRMGAAGEARAAQCARLRRFGADIALSFDGRTLAVGAQNEGYDAPSQDAGPGAVFVFTRRHGAWAQQAMLQATNPQDAASFGRSVEISAGGNVLAVGAPYEAAGDGAAPTPEAGAVYVFRRHGLQWTPQAALHAPSPQSYDQFGLGVRLSDDGRTLAVLCR